MASKLFLKCGRFYIAKMTPCDKSSMWGRLTFIVYSNFSVGMKIVRFSGYVFINSLR